MLSFNLGFGCVVLLVCLYSVNNSHGFACYKGTVLWLGLECCWGVTILIITEITMSVHVHSLFSDDCYLSYTWNMSFHKTHHLSFFMYHFPLNLAN